MEIWTFFRRSFVSNNISTFLFQIIDVSIKNVDIFLE